LQGGWSKRAKLITKLPPFEDDAFCSDVSWELAVRNSVLNSCANLNVKKIDTLMLHRAKHLMSAPIVKESRKIKEEGIVENIGVSVQSPEELKFALECDFVTIIQMPFNILDHRWRAGIQNIMHVKKRRYLIVHARSSLLQGLLCSKSKNDWMQAGIENYDEIIDWLQLKFKQHAKMSISDLCIGYVNSQSWIDSVVVGVESLSNLHSNLKSISMPFMGADALKDIDRSKPIVTEFALNPSTWS
jgi:aryl-alcohol dehydrogenase-like predicted oxidoreductase